jgi:hypothetical protein
MRLRPNVRVVTWGGYDRMRCARQYAYMMRLRWAIVVRLIRTWARGVLIRIRVKVA